MITKTLNLDDAYQKLFDDIRIASNGSINVNNLETFFGSIKEIAECDSKFLRLPLDEPLFEIDANTRKITVPNEFKSNGVSVQGDHLAEIIFFRIERYFDYTDLSTCDIEINWKMGNKEGKTSRFIKFDDILVEPDETKTSCIIFGWPINDIVTEKSGSLTFAVEFHKIQENKIAYRFNTVPTTVNIKDGLIISEEIQPISLDDDIIKSLVNSSFGNGTAAVGDVEWRINGQEDEDGIFAEGTNAYVPYVNLNTILGDNNVPQSESKVFYAKGFVDNGTFINYTDMNNNPADEGIEVSRFKALTYGEASQLENTPIYQDSALSQQITDTSGLDNETEVYISNIDENNTQYYVKEQNDDNERPVYRAANADDIASNVTLYEKIGKIEVQEAGQYVIRAQGFKMGKDADDENWHKIGSGDVKSTSIVTIPEAQAPTDITITVSAPPEPPRASDEEVSPYSFEENNEDGKQVVYLNTIVDGETVTYEGTITASIPESDNYGAIKYEWINQDNENEPIVRDSGFKINSLTTDTLNVTKKGTYKVQVTNYLNNTEKKSDLQQSVEIIATPLAGMITSADIYCALGSSTEYTLPIEDNFTYWSQDRMAVNSAKLQVVIDDIVGEQGKITYYWYKQNTSLDENNNPITSLELITSGASNQYTVSQGEYGMYIAIVENNCHGSIYRIQTKPVDVKDGIRLRT